MVSVLSAAGRGEAILCMMTVTSCLPDAGSMKLLATYLSDIVQESHRPCSRLLWSLLSDIIPSIPSTLMLLRDVCAGGKRLMELCTFVRDQQSSPSCIHCGDTSISSRKREVRFDGNVKGGCQERPGNTMISKRKADSARNSRHRDALVECRECLEC